MTSVLCLCLSSIKHVVDQNIGEEQVCDERDGWCVLGTKDKLRDMISAMIKKVIRDQKRKENIHHWCVIIHVCCLFFFNRTLTTLKT